MQPRSWPVMRIRALRHLPAHLPGKARLARAVLRGIQPRENVVVESSSGAKFAVPHLAEPVAFHLLVNGAYEPDTQNFILRNLSEGDVLIDVGANIGVFTVPAAQKVGPRGKVLAAEPSPAVFPYLAQNILMNGLDNVVALSVAASDQNRDGVPFYAAPSDHFGMGALAPQFHSEPQFVRTKTLDNIVAENAAQRIRVLKVDVEGHEIAVFRGAQDLLTSSQPPVIVFEFCDWAESRFPNVHPGMAQEFLMCLGYRICKLSEYRDGGPPLQAPLTTGSEMLVAERKL